MVEGDDTERNPRFLVNVFKSLPTHRNTLAPWLFIFCNKLSVCPLVASGVVILAPSRKGKNSLHRGRRTRHQGDRPDPYINNRGCAESNRASENGELRAGVRLGERDGRTHSQRVGPINSVVTPVLL